MKRALRLAAALLVLAGPAAAGPKILGRGGSGAPPQITYSPPALNAPVSSGTPAGTATISGLSGGTWSMSPATPFNVNGSTGLVSSVATVNGGTYPSTLTYTDLVSGQTIAVALPTNIVVNGGGGCPAGKLDLSCAANSGLIAAVFY